jgi:N-acetylmuramoyl-L-alanine amidase
MKLVSVRGVLRNVALLCIFLLSSSLLSPSQKRYSLRTIVIDAGHGGKDGGCLGTNSKEKDIALAIALKLGKLVEENFQDVKVIYTRKTDVFVELHERASIANNAKADLFICIHCNSACYYDRKTKKVRCNRETDGVETWVMGLHKSGENLEVAKRENEVVCTL